MPRAHPIGDDVLRLIFTACHPLLPAASRVALTLKVVAGLSTAEIARAPGWCRNTVAQRIVRAKRTLSRRACRSRCRRRQLGERGLGAGGDLPDLQRGYTATAGSHWMRPDLTTEALRLGHMLAALAPRAEVHGLLALMELQASRGGAHR